VKHAFAIVEFDRKNRPKRTTYCQDLADLRAKYSEIVCVENMILSDECDLEPRPLLDFPEAPDIRLPDLGPPREDDAGAAS
jgi:hypothetical protein